MLAEQTDGGMSAERLAQRKALAEESRQTTSAEKIVRATARLLDLQAGEAEDEFLFPAMKRATRPRIFGGQVIAQALVAANKTVSPEKIIHSLHAYFLRGGDETKPLHFRVHRDFDGRSFANRRVVVRQDGKVIFNLTASFHKPEPGLEHQVEMPDVLPPEQCLDFADQMIADPNVSDAQLAQMARMRPFEMRTNRPLSTERGNGHYQWYRMAAPIADDNDLHRAFLAYLSDMGLLSSAMIPHGLTWSEPGLFSTSLDHAMWFHSEVRLDDWVLFVMDSDWTGGARGINRGRIFTRDGRLVASVAQEGLLRITSQG